MKLEDIDFDNNDVIEKQRKETVEVPIGVLHSLLSAYYSGGGEPSSYNERLQEVMNEPRNWN